MLLVSKRRTAQNSRISPWKTKHTTHCASAQLVQCANAVISTHLWFYDTIGHTMFIDFFLKSHFTRWQREHFRWFSNIVYLSPLLVSCINQIAISSVKLSYLKGISSLVNQEFHDMKTGFLHWGDCITCCIEFRAWWKILITSA